MTRWFAVSSPSQQPSQVVTLELRPGGRYEVVTTAPDGKVYRLRGVYQEVKRPEKLVFTWSWEGGDFQDSVVTVELRRLGQSNFTEMTLTHERLPEKWREEHRKGWIGCFDLLEAALKEGA